MLAPGALTSPTLYRVDYTTIKPSQPLKGD
jgi:hypothetical protein